MSELPFPEPAGEVAEIEPSTLRDRIEAGDRLVVLDARNTADFESWHIDGPTVQAHNVPYFTFIDGVDEAALEPLPTDREIVVVCAKGKASRFVVDRLDDLGYDAAGLVDGMRGWAGIYDRREVSRYDGAGTLYQYHRHSSGCLAYLLVSDGEAAVFDPLAAFVDRYRADAAAADATLSYALDTHVHADHVSGVRALDDEVTTGVVPAAAAERGITYTDTVRTVADGEGVSVGEATVEARHTPGHTTGMTSFLIDGTALVTGDGLFADNVARPDLEAGDDGAPGAASTLYDSLHERILALDDDVVVAGGHTSDSATPAADGTYTATLGALREAMPLLSVDRETFVERVLANMPPRPANYEAIIETNLGRRDTDAEEALTLELGPNNCAAGTGAATGD